MIELMMLAQLNTVPQNSINGTAGNVITRPAPVRNRTQFNPPVQNPNFVPKLQVEPFPKQPSLTDYLELQRRNGNNFGESRERLDRRY